MDDFNLERFVAAQRDTYDRALREITEGQKRTHWIWFIFPQITGLGHSAMAQRYAIRSLDEARAYLTHSVLGPRLLECVAALQALPVPDAEAVFGPVDAMKVRSSLSLFAEADPAQPLFAAALKRWFAGRKDPRTIELLQS